MTDKKYTRFEDDPEAPAEPDNLKGSEIKKELEQLTSKLKSTKFDAFAIPADLTMAKDHLLATRIAKEVIKKGKQNVDDQSGFPVENNLVDLTCELEEMSFLSPGYPMYFQFIKLVLYFTTVVFITSTLYGAWANSSGHDCINSADLDNATRSDYEKLIEVCISNKVSIFSLANRRTDDSSLELQEIFNLLTVVLLVVINRFLKKTVHDTGVKLDEQAISSSDYTVRVIDLPNNFDENEDIDAEIKNFISKAIPNKVLNIQRINVCYKMDQKNELSAELKKAVHVAESLKSKKKIGAAKTDELNHLNQLEKDIDLIKTKIELISLKFKHGKDVRDFFNGEAYITFETQAEAKEILDHFNLTFFQRFFGSNYDFIFRGNKIGVVQAAEPSDIVWENAGISGKILLIRRLTSLLIIGLLLVGCTWVIYWISQEKTGRMQTLLDQAYDNGNPKSNDFPIQIISSIASAATVFANYVLKFFITKLVDFCKFGTETQRIRIYTGALAWSQFLNTSLILSLIAEVFHNYWGLGGLVTTAFEVQFIAAGVAIGLGVFDHEYWLKVWKMRKIEKKAENDMPIWMHQEDAHSAFEYPKYDFASKYALYIKVLLTAAYFASFVPLGVPIAIVVFAAGYWIDKYTLLRRRSRGVAYGSDLPNLLCDFLDYAVVFFAIGAWQFHRYTSLNNSSIPVVGVIIAALSIIIPLDKIYSHFHPIIQEKGTEDLYSRVRTTFVEDYDRFNPAFKEDAIARFTYVREHGLVKKKTTLKTTTKEDDQKSEEGHDDGIKHKKSSKKKSIKKHADSENPEEPSDSKRSFAENENNPTTLVSPSSMFSPKGQIVLPEEQVKDEKNIE